MIRLAIPSIDRLEFEAVRKVLKSGYLVQGKKVADFENTIAGYLKVDHAVAVNSGTSALHLALLSFGIGPGDEVIVPDYTFPATANVVELVGAKPVFADIEPLTFNIDPDHIRSLITKRTRAIIPVHLFGQSSDLTPVLQLARKHRLKVIEDAACALGASYKGRKCGTIGDAGCFSFHPRKLITTGEGGIVVTNDRSAAKRLRTLRNHGIELNGKSVDFVLAGFNYRMTEIQAAMGLVQMKKLDALISCRQRIAGIYDENLSSIGWIRTPALSSCNTHVYQAYIIQIPRKVSRERLIGYLRKNGVEANFGTYALHRLSFYRKKYQLSSGQFPNTERIYQTSIALPVFERLGENQIRKIACILRKFP